MDRRNVLAGLAALPIIAPPAVARPARSMQDVAGAANMMFGVAVRASQLFADDAFRAAVARECGSITPELEMKWDHIERTRGVPDFTDADRLVRFAQTTGKDVHGHALLWHRSIPAWVLEALAAQPDWAMVRDHFAAVMSRYRTTVRQWDVVNEPLDPASERADGLRASPFLTAFGPDYIRRAFDEAREIAPDSVLFLNEFGLLYDVPEAKQKREALLRLLEGLKRAGTPIDGIGVQCHLELARTITFNQRIVRDLFNQLGALGLQVRISEFDILEADTALPKGRRDRRVADAARQLLDVAIDNRAVGSISCWGLSDRYSWLPAHGNAGLNRGLPLNSDLERKPFYDEIIAAFRRRQV